MDANSTEAASVGGSGNATGGGMDPWRGTFTWHVREISRLLKLTLQYPASQFDDHILSDTFEAGICTWRLCVCTNKSRGDTLSAKLVAVDDMWEPRADYKLTIVNQLDTNKSINKKSAEAFTRKDTGQGLDAQISALEAVPGWILNDTLVLSVNITVQHEPRFDLYPGDLELRLPCGAKLKASWLLLRMASEIFREAPPGDSMAIDGPLGAWVYILGFLNPGYIQPPLTLGGVYTVLPTAYKYGFTKILAVLGEYVKDRALTCKPASYTNDYSVTWLALAERLHLDGLLEKIVDDLRTVPADDLALAFIAKPGGKPAHGPAAPRGEVQALGSVALVQLLTMTVQRLKESDERLKKSEETLKNSEEALQVSRTHAREMSQRVAELEEILEDE